MASRTFCWSERYSVNIAVLDRQHQGLFDVINELNHALAMGLGAAAADPVLKKLVDYATKHFTTEEMLMTEHNFPSLATHRTEHQAFAQSVDKFLKSRKENKTGVPVEIMLFLQTWLQNHILKTDKNYSAYLNARGVR